MTTGKDTIRRICLKLSGESLSSSKDAVYRKESLLQQANNIKHLQSLGLEIIVVVGAGNILRGRSALSYLPRNSADSIGMLATIMNGIALKETLQANGVDAEHFTAFPCETVAPLYTVSKASFSLSSGNVVIVSGGTSNPYFTTDSAACLRALELSASLLFKATKVDGVFTKDPLKHKDALHHQNLSYQNCLENGLEVMDLTAFSLAKENNLPIFVFNMDAIRNIKDKRPTHSNIKGTLISNEENIRWN